MLKIGDFSKLSRVSIKALRLYDRLGLLKPARVDRFTGYRYYAAEQITRLNRILDLKHLGFSLEQISQLLNEQITATEIQRILRLKETEITQAIATERSRLARVETRLKQLEKEMNMSDYAVTLKKVEPIYVVSVREILPNYSAIGQLFDPLTDYLSSLGIKKFDYCAAIWHDDEYKEKDVDGEALVSIDKSVASREEIDAYDLPGVETMACVVHKGSYETLNIAYQTILDWIDRHDYRIVGSNREIYICGGSEQDNESYITEIQFPVEKT